GRAGHDGGPAHRALRHAARAGGGGRVISVELTIVIYVVCLIGEAFFSGSEMAVVSANRTQLRRRAAAGDRGAQLALAFLAEPQRLLATTLFGTNLSVVISTTVVTLEFLTRGLAEWRAVLVLSPTLLVLGEMVPKTLFQQHADWLVVRIIFPLRWFATLFTP